MRTEIDFLDEKDKIVKNPKKKIVKIGKIITYLLIILVILFASFSYGMFSSGENLAQTFGNVGLWGQIKHLIGSGDKDLLGEDEDRINVLLLGMGGGDHDGPFLSDTIIIASFQPKEKKVALISVPRDMLVQIPGYGWRKINHANAYGEIKNPGRGGLLAKEVVSQTFGIPIHYYLRIDFAGFIKIIDTLGGVSIDVENVVDDELYPVKGKETATTTERYEHLYIDRGEHKFDGEMALKYVRSRHAKGIEGSDFARSQRQQKLILAVKEKILSFGTLTNPYRLSKLMDAVSAHLTTDFEVWELLQLFNLAKDIDQQNIIHRVFDDSPDSQLRSTVTEDGAYVLVPKAGNFSEMQNIVQNIFDPDLIAKQQPKRIEIQNGTKVNGLAYQASLYLQSLGYQIVRAKNAPTQDYQQTVIYNLNEEGADDITVNNIASLLKAQVAGTLPEWVKATSSPAVSPNTDILIILGQDQKDL